MSDLYIFDPYDNLLTILSNEAEEACPFWSAPFKETLNQGSTFEFTAVADHEDSRHLIAENQVAFMDKDRVFRLFVIKEPEEIDGVDGPEVRCVCEPAMLELNDEIIEDKRPYNTTLEDALSRALEGMRWQVGETADLGINSTNFYYESVTSAITNVINTWGGELRDRVEIEDNKIVGRYIDILSRRGKDTGKRWEIDKDIISISHKVQSYPKTALYGRGASLETENGGYSRKIDFASVEWSVAKGDPVDKPLYQEWVGDPEALEVYGRPNGDGTLRHRFGIFDNGDIEDPEKLLKATWEALQEQKRPLDNYQMDVFLLEDITGYEHEKARLGDTTFAIDRSFAKPIEIEQRIISFEYDVADPDNTGTIEFGQFINLFTETEDRLDKIESKLNDKTGIWNKIEQPIVDADYPDIIPVVPGNFTANGNFKTIMLEWDYDSSSYLSAYELFASQVAEFTPDTSNLVWRGKAGGYAFKAEINEQWYFKLRAVNYHNRSSDFTEEISAQTVQVSEGDIAPQTITDEIIAENANIDGAKIAEATITDLHVTGTISANKISLGPETTYDTGYDPTLLKENIDGELDAVRKTVDDMSIELSQDKIVEKVTKSTEFMNQMVEQSPFITESEFERKANEINMKFEQTGGANIFKNSIGLSGTDMWTVVSGANYITTTESVELSNLGFASGFLFLKDDFTSLPKSFEQIVNARQGLPHTISIYLKRTQSSGTAEDGLRIVFYDSVDDSHEIGRIEAVEGAQNEYIKYAVTITPTTNIIKAKFHCDPLTVGIASGLMGNVGDVALHWSMAQGEFYNKTVKTDSNGVRVLQLDESGKPIGYTAMTHSKFAGYYDVDGNGSIDESKDSPDEVFRVDRDEFVTKKQRIGPIKIVSVTGGGYNGIAFVPS